MNFEPQKFFIGLIDFFSVWLPGALLVYLTKDQVGRLVLHRDLPLSRAEDWVVFLFAAYLLGHLAFLLGSFLDDWAYDPLRKSTRDGQIERLAAGKRLRPRRLRRFAEFMYGDFDPALRQALRLRGEELGPAGATSAVNAFQWCKAKLALEHREALADVERFEADSKFFRSLCAVVVLLLIMEVAKLVAAQSGPAGGLAALRFIGLLLGGLALFVVAFWRYAERRVKATSQAYWYVLTDACATPAARSRAFATGKELTHAGGLVLSKVADGRVKYLRVPANPGTRPWEVSVDAEDPIKWVLPHGHIEAGESPAACAVREVLEESGLWARVRDELIDVSFYKKGESVRARFFLMELLEPAFPRNAKRDSWLPDPRGEDPRRKPDWKELGHHADLHPASQGVVKAAARYLEILGKD